jgi:hypothetical protein
MKGLRHIRTIVWFGLLIALVYSAATILLSQALVRVGVIPAQDVWGSYISVLPTVVAISMFLSVVVVSIGRKENDKDRRNK